MSEADANILIRPDNISRKSEQIKKLLKIKTIEEADKKKIVDALKGISANDRNLVAHGILCYDDSGDRNSLSFVNLQKSKSLMPSTLVSVLKEVEDLTDALMAINVSMGYSSVVQDKEFLIS